MSEIVTTTANGTTVIPWEALAGVIIGLISALAGYFRAKAEGKDKELVAKARDVELQKEAVQDLAIFAANAFRANADGKVTQEEFDELTIEGKTLAIKYGDKFGVGDQVRLIINGFSPAKREVVEDAEKLPATTGTIS